MSAQCSAIAASGERCKNFAASASQWCSAHDPARSDARRRAASKGGKSRGSNSEIQTLKANIQKVISGVLDEVYAPNVGAVAIQGMNTLVRIAELERKIREQDEMLERIEALEQNTRSATASRGGGSWADAR